MPRLCSPLPHAAGGGCCAGTWAFTAVSNHGETASLAHFWGVLGSDLPLILLVLSAQGFFFSNPEFLIQIKNLISATGKLHPIFFPNRKMGIGFL